MKTICSLFCVLVLVSWIPAFAEEAPADVTVEAVESTEALEQVTVAQADAEDAIEGVEVAATLDQTVALNCSGAEKLFSTALDGLVTTSWNCTQCCNSCDPVSSRIPCEEWCGCNCD